MRVMVGIDDSDESLYALRWAIDNLFSNGLSTGVAGGEAAASLILVHVHQPSKNYGVAPPSAFAAGPGVAAYPSITSVDSERKSQEISAGVLARALNMCNDKVIFKVETMILEGDIKDTICETSEKMNVDLLIVGSRGLGRIKRAFLGSVSDYCAHHAKCPTLIVKPPRENRQD